MMKSSIGTIGEKDVFNVTHYLALLCYGEPQPHRPENFMIDYSSTPLTCRFPINKFSTAGWIEIDIKTLLMQSGFMTVTLSLSGEPYTSHSVSIHGHSLGAIAAKLANAHEKALEQRRSLRNVVTLGKRTPNHAAHPSS